MNSLPPPRHRILGVSIAGIVLILDQLIKYIVTFPIQIE